jgi:cell division protein DivIC
VSLRQLIIASYALLLGGLAVTGLVLFKDAHDELSQLASVESQNRQKLAEAQQRLKEQEQVLDRLKNDPAFVDRVIRTKMGYSKQDEYIFRFEADQSTGRIEALAPSALKDK